MLEAFALCLAHVTDGYTLVACDGERIRLAGIDAPETARSPRCRGCDPTPCQTHLCQMGGRAMTTALDALQIHELRDRTSLLRDNLHDWLIEHPAITPPMRRQVNIIDLELQGLQQLIEEAEAGL